MYRPTSRSSVDRYIGHYVGRYSVDRFRSTDISGEVFSCRSSIDLQIDRQSVEIASVVCRQCVGESSVEYR